MFIEKIIKVGSHDVRAGLLDGSGNHVFLLIHGIGLSMKYLLPLAHELSRQGRVWLVDLPGFGASPQPRTVLSIEEYADIIDGVMVQSHITSPVLIGQSMGCQIVVELMRRHSKFETGILIGPVINCSEHTTRQQTWRLLQDIAREKQPTRRVAAYDYLRCGIRWYLSVFAQMMKYPLEQKVSGVKGRIIYVRGTHDVIAPQQWLLHLQNVTKESEIWEMDGAHNFVHISPGPIARRCAEITNA